MKARWPQMMKRQTAAEYCDLSVSSFNGEVLRGRLPSPVELGGRDHWYRPAIDRALALLTGDITEYEEEFWARGDPKYRRDLLSRYINRSAR